MILYQLSTLTRTDMAHYLADVRQSMLSCRRTIPIPQDFLQSLHTHQLSLRSLIPHLDPPIPPERSQFSLQSKALQEDEQQPQSLRPILNGGLEETAKGYVPKHFPHFPSKHTYKATAEYPDREFDPRKVRERATEEGRLGEEALRRLVSTGSGYLAHAPEQKEGLKSTRAKRNQMFLETMAAVSEKTSDAMEIDGGLDLGKGKQKEGDKTGFVIGSGRLSSAVNAEKKYWRKPAVHANGTNGGS